MKLNDQQDEGPALIAPNERTPTHSCRSNRNARDGKRKKVHWTPSVTSQGFRREIMEPSRAPIDRHLSSSQQPLIFGDEFMQDDFFARDFVPSWGQSRYREFSSQGKWESPDYYPSHLTMSSQRGPSTSRQVIPPTVPDAPAARGPPPAPIPTRLPTPEFSDCSESESFDHRSQDRCARKLRQKSYQHCTEESGDVEDKWEAQLKAAQMYIHGTSVSGQAGSPKRNLPVARLLHKQSERYTSTRQP